VSSVAGFSLGQKIIVDAGVKSETVVIAAIGTSGGTSVGTAVKAGGKAIPVGGLEGFSAGQTITIGEGVNSETAVIASTVAGRRRFGGPANVPVDTIKVTTPLAKAHEVGAQIAGSGITLTAPLTKQHDNGMPVATNISTPGGPNQYAVKP